uniref:Putative secreted protein n=1 Tax=Anopheles marajoara TaxID=58244 RepID=A0A2M4C6A2_9DIPT
MLLLPLLLRAKQILVTAIGNGVPLAVASPICYSHSREELCVQCNRIVCALIRLHIMFPFRGRYSLASSPKRVALKVEAYFPTKPNPPRVSHAAYVDVCLCSKQWLPICCLSTQLLKIVVHSAHSKRCCVQRVAHNDGRHWYGRFGIEVCR